MDIAKAHDALVSLCRSLIDLGAECIVLGCTELPVALTESHVDGVPVFNPSFELAREMVRQADEVRARTHPEAEGTSSS